jgi:transketolase
MRDAFVRALTDAVRRDPQVVVLTADLGIGLFDEIAAAAPGRFLNVGIAEQNLIGVAAGLALAGKKPVVYSIAPFVTSRPHDQVRVDVACHRAPVLIVGVGGGLAYGSLGPTHHAIEDLALMRALPDMTVVAPGTPSEAAAATDALVAHPGPAYLRLGKNGEPDLTVPGQFRLGAGRWLRHGPAATLCTTGTMLPTAVEVADLLAEREIDVGVLHLPTVKPLDGAALAEAAEATPLVVTLEEHTLPAGFGSAVLEALADQGRALPALRFGIPDTFAPAVGSREYLLGRYGLTPEAIAQRVALRLRLGITRAAA